MGQFVSGWRWSTVGPDESGPRVEVKCVFHWWKTLKSALFFVNKLIIKVQYSEAAMSNIIITWNQGLCSSLALIKYVMQLVKSTAQVYCAHVSHVIFLTHVTNNMGCSSFLLYFIEPDYRKAFYSIASENWRRNKLKSSLFTFTLFWVVTFRDLYFYCTSISIVMF